MSTMVPQFEISERLRKRLRKSETRATISAQLNANPDNLNTTVATNTLTVYKRYPNEVAIDGATSYFRFEQILSGDKFKDTMRFNPTPFTADALTLQPGLITPALPDTEGYSVTVTGADAIAGIVFDAPWPGSVEFIFQTTDVGPADLWNISGDDASVVMTLNADGTITVESRDGADVMQRSADSDDDLSDGVEHHIVYTDDGTVAKLYVDGVLQ